MHLHIAFAYTDKRLACIARHGDGSEIAVESREAEAPWCLYWQALIRALNMAVTWKATRLTLYTHHVAGDERCDGWVGACDRLVERIPDGVEFVTITAERNAALRMAER